MVRGGRGHGELRRLLRNPEDAEFSGPVQLHFEYPGFGGADGGKLKLEIPKEKLVAQMRKDLEHVRKLMHQAQLT